VKKPTAELVKKLKSAAHEEIMCRESSDASDDWYDLATPKNILQLIEVALPILEQQERGENKWLHWNGEMALPPVDVHVMVEVKLRNGVTVIPRQAQHFAWRNGPAKNGFDIIAYRIIPERATKQNGD